MILLCVVECSSWAFQAHAPVAVYGSVIMVLDNEFTRACSAVDVLEHYNKAKYLYIARVLFGWSAFLDVQCS